MTDEHPAISLSRAFWQGYTIDQLNKEIVPARLSDDRKAWIVRANTRAWKTLRTNLQAGLISPCDFYNLQRAFGGKEPADAYVSVDTGSKLYQTLSNGINKM
jgi:hypothetical protein